MTGLRILGATAPGLAAHLHAHVQRARAQVLDVGQGRPDKGGNELPIIVNRVDPALVNQAYEDTSLPIGHGQTISKPSVVARMIATIDDVSEGRCGLNIVTGWNKPEYEALGLTLPDDHETRYAYAQEWFDLVSKLWTADDHFDWDGRYFKAKKVKGDPKPMRGTVPIINAAGSPQGRGFATDNANFLFTPAIDLDRSKVEIQELKAQAKAKGREVKVLTFAHVICRPTEAEAQAKQQTAITESVLSIQVQENQGKAELARSRQDADRVRTLAVNGFADGLSLKEHYDPSLPPVLGDEDQLIQIFLNLVKNAAEAAHSRNDGRGEISIHTAYRHGVRVRAAKGQALRGAPLEVRVIDNGPGVPEHIRESLFQPFVTTKANGTGLGLALVTKLVTAHGGLIDFESEPGRTVFRVLLPVAPEPSSGDA